MAYIQFADFMFLKVFGPKWKEKFLTLPGNLITEYDKYALAVKRDKSSWIPCEISKTVAFFMKHSRSVTCKVTSSQHRHTEIVRGFEMPCMLRFTADLAVIERLKSLL